MATYAENLITARDAYATELALGNVKPSYNIDGQQVSWNEYRKSLLDSIASLNKLINESAPFEEMSTGYSPGDMPNGLGYWP